MARSDTLQIYIDTYQFTREVFMITHKFSREFKYCLGEQINKDVLQLLFYIFQANRHEDDRVTYLDSFLAAFDMVLVELRLCHDMKVLSDRQIAHLSQYTDKIVRQATAWQNYTVSHQQLKKKESSESPLPESDAIGNG